MGKEFGVSVVNKQTNKKLGILETEENFFHMIKNIYEKPTANIIFSGERLHTFP